MEKKTIFLLIGGAGLALALLISVVVFLRFRNAPESSLQMIAQPPRVSRAPASSKDARPDLTPQEKKQAEELTELIRRTPKDIRSTWTPEFHAQQKSLTR